ncbi:MAG: hypothetical protein Q4G60_09815 [bacterium]|nr:hypothetical protein [bacterium]
MKMKQKRIKLCMCMAILTVMMIAMSLSVYASINVATPLVNASNNAANLPVYVSTNVTTAAENTVTIRCRTHYILGNQNGECVQCKADTYKRVIGSVPSKEWDIFQLMDNYSTEKKKFQSNARWVIISQEQQIIEAGGSVVMGTGKKGEVITINGTQVNQEGEPVVVDLNLLRRVSESSYVPSFVGEEMAANPKLKEGLREADPAIVELSFNVKDIMGNFDVLITQDGQITQELRLTDVNGYNLKTPLEKFSLHHETWDKPTGDGRGESDVYEDKTDQDNVEPPKSVTQTIPPTSEPAGSPEVIDASP